MRMQTRTERLRAALDIFRRLERELESPPTMWEIVAYLGGVRTRLPLESDIAHEWTEDLAQAILALEAKYGLKPAKKEG